MEQYRRDAAIIADLLLAIDKINRVAQKNGIGIRIVAAVRSEVLGAIGTIGREINKLMSDFGVRITWDVAGDDVETHPLLQIILKRLRASEREAKMRSAEDNDQTIWLRYFPETIRDGSSQRYILHQTWYRPRDIVRLLNIAKEGFPSSPGFSADTLQRTRKIYSEQSWVELSEELATQYRDIEIRALRQILTRIDWSFTAPDFASRMSRLADQYPDVADLERRHKATEILLNLYKIGALGNVRRRPDGVQLRYRFVFRGDDDACLDDRFCVHAGLKATFSVE